MVVHIIKHFNWTKRIFSKVKFLTGKKRHQKVSDDLPAIYGQRSNTMISLKFYCWAIFVTRDGEEGLDPKFWGPNIEYIYDPIHFCFKL